MNDAGAIAVAERVIASLASPIVVDGYEIRTGASIGIAFALPTYNSPGEILRDATISELHKQLLIDIYRSFQREAAGDRVQPDSA